MIYCGLFIHLTVVCIYIDIILGVWTSQPFECVHELSCNIAAFSKLHTISIKKWIKEGTVFKFWGDNVAKQRHVQDQVEMLHMNIIHLV